MPVGELAFPERAPPAWLETPGLEKSGLSLRPAKAVDLPLLRALYAESRASELRAVPWPAAAKRAFCDSQFALQHRHYVTQTPPGVFLIVSGQGQFAGRFYLQQTERDLRVVDILLAAAHRSRGWGSALLRWTQAVASTLGVETLSLHVEQHNDGAFRLYRRLGFCEESSSHVGYRRMAWRPPPGGTAPVS